MEKEAEFANGAMAASDIVSSSEGEEDSYQYDVWHLTLLAVCSIIKLVLWSHLSVTGTAFRSLLASPRVFTPSLNVVNTFGTKTNDKQRVMELAYRCVQSYSLTVCLI
jgi:hypothetical protein